MLINLSEVMSVKDKVRHMEVPLELKQFQLNGEAYEILDKPVISFQFCCTSEKKVNLECKTNITLSIPCNRCLEEVKVSIPIHVERELDFNERTEEQDEVDEMNYIEGYDLNVDSFLFEEILVSFPTKVLCKPDCQGICETCGVNKNRECCQCDLQGKDPRMSIIQDIYKNFTQTEK